MVYQLAEDPNAFARRLFRRLPARYDLLAELLSFGQNRRWRRLMVGAATSGRPGRLLDVATGTAGVALSVVGSSDAEVVGVDLSDDMLAVGRQRVAAAGKSRRVHLAQARGEQLPFPDASFDALTFTYLLRYVRDPARAVAEMARVVRPGGVIASLEFHLPPSLFWRLWWTTYTRVALPLLGALLGGRPWYEVGRFLGPSISEHYRRHPLAETAEDWRRAGIREVEARLMSLGGGVVMWGERAGG
jgi:demethylmenaquinone methyltransferase/2-methoxy-6-polyprenyl-1,4-benzoquinol methylase